MKRKFLSFFPIFGIHLISFVLTTLHFLQALDAPWVFQVPHVGQVLTDGGYYLERNLGGSSISPEFTFQIQLFYANTIQDRGLMGASWSIPQLDSRLLVKEKYLLWIRPDGNAIWLIPEEKEGFFHDQEGTWEAKRINSQFTEIRNLDGWVYTYKETYPYRVESPTQRAVEFEWQKNKLKEVFLVDMPSKKSRSIISCTYNDSGRLTGLQLANGKHEFQYETLKSGLLNAWKRPDGTVEKYGYEEIGNLIQIVEEKKETNWETQFIPPIKDRKPDESTEAKKDPANQWLIFDGVNSYEYPQPEKKKPKEVGEVVFIDALKNRTSHKLSRNRGINEQTGADGLAQKVFYYRAPGQKYDNKLRRIQSGDQILLDNRYEKALGRLTESTDQNGVTTFYEYPPTKIGSTHQNRSLLMKPIKVYRGTRKDKKLVLEFEYDEDGRLLRKVDEYGKETNWFYNNRGETEKVVDPEGKATLFQYDLWGRITLVKSGDAQEFVEYDDQDRIKSRTGTDGIKTVFVYDNQSRVLKVMRNGDLAVEYVRDSTGNVIGEKNAAGQIKKIERNEKGQVTAEILPGGMEIHYGLDSLGRKISQTDGMGNTFTFSYDSADRMTEQKNPLGQPQIWKYNDQGRLMERGNGVQIIKYDWDDHGRLLGLDYGRTGEKVAYVYDQLGRLIEESTPTLKVLHFYDDYGRLLAWQAKRSDKTDQVLRFSYNGRGQRTAFVLSEFVPEQKAQNNHAGIASHYDALLQQENIFDSQGRLSEIKVNGRSFVSYVFDGRNRIMQKKYSNGMTATLAYDPQGRLSKVQYDASFFTTPLRLEYEWDSLSQLARRTWNDEIQRFVYSEGGQLLKVYQEISKTPLDKPSRGVLLESYAYDKAGNMTEKNIQGFTTKMTYNNANQLIASESNGRKLNFVYDTAGRVIKTVDQNQKLAGNLQTIGWLDKTIAITKPDLTRVGFDYYPDGQLAAKGTLPKLEALPESVPDPKPASSGGMKISDFLSAFQTAKKALHLQESIDLTPSKDQASFEVNEIYVWDDLALLRKGDDLFVNEPHPSGGAVLAKIKKGNPSQIQYHLNDMLGTTLAFVEGEHVTTKPLTAFGQPRPMNAAISTTPEAIPIPAVESLDR
jgi:YD repeat-containing protein